MNDVPKQYLFTSTMFQKSPLNSGPFDIRLADGPTPAEGRLEVYHDALWGTVCDDGFDLNDGTVACRQLGYDYSNDTLGDAFYGEGSGDIWLDDMQCVGNEKLLSQCESQVWGHINCGPNEDVGIRCFNFEGR